MSAAHLYVHVPFCARRCTYCDFSIAVRRPVPVAEYLGAVRAELARHARLEPPGTVYLGGGTPSLLGGEGLRALADLLPPLDRVVEFTLEANPDDVSPESARAWKDAGVSRVSLGVQSFDDRVLAWMHRTHSAAAVAPAVANLREAGLTNLSLDLIFALPEFLGRDLSRDLDLALALEPSHISLYGLAVEPGTPLARQVARAEVTPRPDSEYEEEYLLAYGRLTMSGYRFYEVSNAALPGKEAVHNRCYWRLEPYLGVGPSAHSYDGATRWWNEPAYARWVERLERGLSPVAGREVLSTSQRRLEETYLALRTSEGMPVPSRQAGDPAPPFSSWVSSGWAVLEGGRIRLTPQGWLRLDVLVTSL
jgi:oxygen-independent coproporphyrinogen-3 oxidase